MVIAYDYVTALMKTLQLATTNHWVDHGPHGYTPKAGLALK